MRVVSAENGKDGIQMLTEQRDIDIVLMDIMLPTMDGYTTIRAIREIAELKDLPIIAVTAKAMKGDREKCLAAGASDYLCKPVESEQLRSTLRLWLHR
jgi:CheY-like chemotaxis protein